MSYVGMLQHRCEVIRLVTTKVNGMPVAQWQTVQRNVSCFVDLQFISKQKTMMWTPEAGRPADRFGVTFFKRTATVKSGDRIKVTKGPIGTFAIEEQVDEARTPRRLHHLELTVKEVAAQLNRKPTYAQKED
jgi:hypothetical protein